MSGKPTLGGGFRFTDPAVEDLAANALEQLEMISTSRAVPMNEFERHAYLLGVFDGAAFAWAYSFRQAQVSFEEADNASIWMERGAQLTLADDGAPASAEDDAGEPCALARGSVPDDGKD